MTSDKSMFKQVLKFLLYIIVLVTPLIFVSNTKELFEFPKMFFIYGLGATIIFLYLMGLIFGRFELKFPPLVILLFIFVNILSTIFSSHVHTSFWGYYSRFNGGLVSLFIYFGLFIVLISVFKKEFIQYLIFNGLILTAIPISLLGIAQHFGWGTSSVDRVYSTLGQANWLAAYLSWPILLYIHRFLKDKFNKRSLFWILAFIASFSCLWFTYSISGFLGFAFGFLVLIMVNRPHYNFSRAFFLLVIVLLVSISFPGMFFLKLGDIFIDIKRIFLSGFFVYAQDVNNISDPGFIRFGIWKGTLDLIFSNLKTFLFGTGPETFAYNFPFFRPNSVNYSSEWDFILNKPHNYFLEVFAETGVFSLILYGRMLAEFFYKKHRWLTPLVCLFLIVNFFGWPITVTSLYFWLFQSAIWSESNEI